MGSLIGRLIRFFRSPSQRYADSVLHQRAAKQVLGTRKDVMSRVSRDYPILESAIVHLMIDAVEFNQLMLVFLKMGPTCKLLKEASSINPKQCHYISIMVTRMDISESLRGSLLAIQKDSVKSCEKMDAAADLIRTIPIDSLQSQYFSELAGYAAEIAEKTYVIPTHIQKYRAAHSNGPDDAVCIGSIFQDKADAYRSNVTVLATK